MSKYDLKKIIPSVGLAMAILLSGCGEKSECEIPARHVHKYTKPITDEIIIETYLDDEYLNISGYYWNEEYIEINKVDEALYRQLNSRFLFDGVTNWDYLFYFMASNHDYLMYFYEYTEVVYHTKKDSEGNEKVEREEIHHEGWHTNPYDSNNTGDVRVYHPRYYGYKVVYENGRFRLEKSREVDDIREVINDYPYFSENCVTEVFAKFHRSPYELPYLTPADFNAFVGPDLSNPNLDTGRVRTNDSNMR